MNKAFVVSDIHGMYKEFEQLLTFWDSNDKLVILGDMIDRGPDSLKVVQCVMELSKKHDVTTLLGNHDQMLLDFIAEPNEFGWQWAHNGGNETLRSFVSDQVFWQSQEEQAIELTTRRPHEYNFIADLPRYYEWGKVLFTHAGFCSWRDCWEETTDNQFIWIREHYRQKNNSGYVNVFGHTPTQLINQDKSDGIWVSADKTYVAIDGACAYGGQLNGLLISDRGEISKTYAIKKGETTCKQLQG